MTIWQAISLIKQYARRIIPTSTNAGRAPAPQLPANYDPTGTDLRCEFRRSTLQTACLAARRTRASQKETREAVGVRWRQDVRNLADCNVEFAGQTSSGSPAMLRTSQYCGGSSCLSSGRLPRAANGRTRVWCASWPGRMGTFRAITPCARPARKPTESRCVAPACSITIVPVPTLR